jgi:hypothetical protein
MIGDGSAMVRPRFVRGRSDVRVDVPLVGPGLGADAT